MKKRPPAKRRRPNVKPKRPKKSNKRRRPTKFGRPGFANYQQGCHPNPKMKRPKVGQLVNYGLEFQLLIPVKRTELSAMERPRKTVRKK